MSDINGGIGEWRWCDEFFSNWRSNIDPSNTVDALAQYLQSDSVITPMTLHANQPGQSWSNYSYDWIHLCLLVLHQNDCSSVRTLSWTADTRAWAMHCLRNWFCWKRTILWYSRHTKLWWTVSILCMFCQTDSDKLRFTEELHWLDVQFLSFTLTTEL